MPHTSAAYDLELTDANGAVTGLMIERPHGFVNGRRVEPGDGSPLTIAELLASAYTNDPSQKNFSPALQNDWSGGVGVDYHTAEGVYTRTPGYACPAGAVTSVAVQGVNNSNTPFVAIEEYAGNIYLAQQGDGGANTARVVSIAGGTGAMANSLNLGANEYLRDLLVADGGNAVNYLFASSSDVNGGNGRIHRFDGGAWISTPAGRFGAEGRNRLAKVHWQTPDGASGWRMVSISGAKKIAYTKPDADPLDQLVIGTWVEDVRIGTGSTLKELVAARHWIAMTGGDGLFSIDGMGNSPNLTSYLARQVQTGTGMAAEIINDYVYMSSGRGIERIFVGTPGLLQQIPGQCSPGWATPAENAYRGYCTAMTTDQGYLVASIFNPSTQMSGVFWGIDRDVNRISTRNPLAWYGPELVVGPDYYCTRLRTSGLAGDLRLWFALYTYSGPNAPALGWLSLPIAGSPFQDLTSGGSMKFATDGVASSTQPFSRLVLSSRYQQGQDDTVTKQVILQIGVGSRGITGGTAGDAHLTVASRADPAPGSTVWPAPIAITASPQATITPSPTVSGRILEDRVAFLAPNGTAAPPVIPVLTSIRRDTWKVVPTVRVVTVSVQYGSGVLNLNQQADDRDPEFVTATLMELTTESGVVLRDRNDIRWLVKLNTVFDAEYQLSEEGQFGKKVTTQIEIALLARLA